MCFSYYQQLLLITALSAILLYLFFFQVSIYKAIQYLGKVIDKFPFRLAEKKPRVFGAAKELLNFADQLNLSAQKLLDNPNASNIRVKQKINIKELLQDQPNFEFDQLIESLCINIFKNYRIRAVAIVINQGGNNFKFFLQGIVGKRLEERLRQAYYSYFFANDYSLFGIKDINLGNNQVFDFTNFGLVQVAAFPITAKNLKSLLWVGYSEDNLIDSEEYLSLQNIASELNEALEFYVNYEELNTKINLAEQASASKSNFIAQASHDIRSPLNNVRIALNYLYDALPEQENKNLIKLALQNCNSAASIVDSILDYSKQMAGELKAEKEVIDLNQLVMKVCENYSLAIKDKMLELNLNLFPKPIFIYADKLQLVRIIANVISNSIKYTKQGSINLNTGLNNNFLVLTVTDSGIGMTKSQLSNIYEPFSKFTDSKEGIGLGMTLTKALVELNAGNITVDSEFGKGTQVKIEFEQVAAKPIYKKNTSLNQKISKILLVDDDQASTISLEKVLKSKGFEVMSANTVDEAKALINYLEPELVITDANMEAKGGEEVAKYCEFKSNKIKVFVVSGKDRQAIKDEFTNTKVDKIFTKPLEVNELIESIYGT